MKRSSTIGLQEEAWIDDVLKGVVEQSRTGLDWNRLVRMAANEGIAPLIFSKINKRDLRDIPDNTVKDFRDFYLGNLVRNQRTINELTKVIGFLKKDGIEVVVVKGVSLLAGVYSDVAIRSISDADLLVRYKDVDKIEGILSDLGFRRYAASDISSFSNELCFEKDGLTRIELRWDMTHHDRFRLLSHLNFDDIFSNSVTSSLDGVEIRIPSPEHQLLLAIFHLSLVHHFSRRIWLYDIVAMIEHYANEFNWLDIVRLAEKYRLKDTLYYTLYKAGKQFDADIVATEVEGIRPAEIRLKLLEISTRRRWDFAIEILLLDQVKDIVRYLVATLFPSKEWIKNHYRTRKRTTFYRVVHPFIMAVSSFKGIIMAMARVR